MGSKCVFVCVSMHTHRSICKCGGLKNALTVWSNSQSMQTNPHVWTDIMGILGEGECKQIEAELQSRAASATRPPINQGLRLGREEPWTQWICSGWVEAWKTVRGSEEELSVLEDGTLLCVLLLLCGHLLSIRDWTLCTSSRAIFKMCCTSWRSAISADHTHGKEALTETYISNKAGYYQLEVLTYHHSLWMQDLIWDQSGSMFKWSIIYKTRHSV